MLNQHWRDFADDVDGAPDDNRNAAVAVTTYVRLNRSAPAAIKQAVGGEQTRLLRRTVLGDPANVSTASRV
jgi:hypothetical protein